MDNGRMFWDRKVTQKAAIKVLHDGSNPRFVEYAALFLSRTNEPKVVFDRYMDKLTFCRNWQKIKKRMRLNRWSDSRIIFWDEIYRVISRHISKDKLRTPRIDKTALSPDLGQIGEKIKKARKAKRWTQGLLAKKCVFSQQTISFIENGYINMSFVTLKKITDALGMKIEIT